MDITYSMISKYKKCPNSFKYSYVDMLRGKEMSNAFALGSYVHELLEAFYIGCMTNSDPVKEVAFRAEEAIDICQDYELRDLGNRMMKNYMNHYANDFTNMKVIATEEEFCVPIPGTNENLRGKFDLIFRDENDDLYIGEHKTTALSIEARKANLELDEQCSIYLWALEQIIGEKPKGVMYNILRKKAPREPGVLKNGGLSKSKSTDITYEAYLKAIHDNNLDEADYKEILNELKERPNPFFGRAVVTRNDKQMKQVERDIIYSCKQINSDDYFMRNSGIDCTRFCQYRDLCVAEVKDEDTDNIISECFVKKEFANPELDFAKKEGTAE